MGLLDPPGLTPAAAAVLFPGKADGYAALARRPEALISGTPTFNAAGAMTSAPVTWPDGTTGTYTALVISPTFLNCVDSWQITYGSKAYTQPTVTRNALGIITAWPTITVATIGDITTALRLRYVFDGLGLADGAAIAQVNAAGDSSLTYALKAHATTTKQPTVALSALNSHDAARFTRANAQYLRTDLFSTGDIITQPATIVAVMKRAVTTAAGQVAGGRVDGSSVSRSMVISSESTSNEATISAFNGGSAFGVSAAPDTNWHIVSAIYDGANSRMHLDGSVATGTITADSAGALPALTLGANHSASGVYYDGWLAEVRVYARALTTTDIATLRANLQARYGL